MKDGIPQGSLLLFLIYMNQVTHHIKHGKLIQYADDTVLICSGSHCQDVYQQLSEDLHLLFSWVESSKMSSMMWFLPRSLSRSCLTLRILQRI